MSNNEWQQPLRPMHFVFKDETEGRFDVLFIRASEEYSGFEVMSINGIHWTSDHIFLKFGEAYPQ